VCPDDDGAAINSYGLNEETFVDFTNIPLLSPLTLAALQSPSNTVMLGELGTNDDLITSRRSTTLADAYKLTAPLPVGTLNDQYDARPSARHTSFTNLAFMDGHVKAMRLEQFYIGQTPPDKWFNPQGF